MKIPFDIKYRQQIENGEYKVETRDGKPVRIICWNRKYGFPICGLAYEKATGCENYVNAYKNGMTAINGIQEMNDDLFIITPEQKPEESDAIKGGDFISDGKRVFLVLANVKERNLGETNSTFCEGRILGVDGVVYCNVDDFKKFKRATSDERAKFIHDLKVGVELKEHPAEWSEEDKVMLNNIIWSVHMKSIKPLDEMDDRSKYKKYEDFLKSLPERFNIQPKRKWSEEDDDCKTKCIHANLAELTWEDIDRIDDLMYLERDKYGDTWNITMQEETCKTVLKKFNEERGHTTQPHWKPSQEHMDALLKLEEAYVLEHERSQETAHLYMVIKSLREELFKLMK